MLNWNVAKASRRKAPRLAERLAATRGSCIVALQECAWGRDDVPHFALYGPDSGDRCRVRVAVPTRLVCKVRRVAVARFWVAVQIGGLGVISVHLPPGSSATNAEIENVLDAIEGTMHEWGAKARNPAVAFVVAGDFNTALRHHAGAGATTGDNLWDGGRGRPWERARRVRIENWLTSAGLVVSSSFAGAPRAHWTWKRWRARRDRRARRGRGDAEGRRVERSKAQIDYIAHSGKLSFVAAGNDRGPFRSDHRLISTSLAWPARAGTLTGGTSLSGWRVGSDAARDAYSEDVRKRMEGRDHACPGEWTGAIAEAVAGATEATTSASRKAAMGRPPMEEKELRHRFRCLPRGPDKVIALHRWRAARAARLRNKEYAIAQGRRAMARRRGPPLAVMTVGGVATEDPEEMTKAQLEYLTELWRAHVTPDLGEPPEDIALSVGDLLPLGVVCAALMRTTSSGTECADGLAGTMLRELAWDQKMGFAQALRYAGGGWSCIPRCWLTDRLWPIRKAKTLRPTASQLRYIRQGALGAKTLLRAALTAVPAQPSWAVGGRPGGRTTDVVGAITETTFQANQWSDTERTVAWASADIARAYDNVPQDKASEAVRNWPDPAPELIDTLMRHGQAALQGESGARLRPTLGLRTGGVESGRVLAQVLEPGVGALIERWRRVGAGRWFGARPPMLLWVDNFFVPGRSEAEAVGMIMEIVGVLAELGMRLKDDLVEVLVAGERNTRQYSIQGPDGRQYTVRRVTALPVLGSIVDYKGDTATAAEHARARASKVWHMHKRTLCSKRVPRKVRLKLWAEAVLPVAAPADAAGWHLTRPMMAAARGWETRHLAMLLHLRPPPTAFDDSSEFAAWRRTARRATESALSAAGVQTVAGRIFHAVWERANTKEDQHDSVGLAIWRHAEREGDARLWRVLAPALARADPRNTHGWRHRAPGRPLKAWSECVHDIWGDEAGRPWRQCEQEALEWAAGRGGPRDGEARPPRAPHDDRPREGPEHGAADQGATQLPADDREFDLARAGVGFVAELVVDAKGVADAAALTAEWPRECASQLATLVEHCWRAAALGLSWRGVRGDPVVWRSREFNAAADALTHIARDSGDHEWYADRATFAGLAALAKHRRVAVRFFSDGGADERASAWGALALAWLGGQWRILAARAARSGTDSVPLCEAKGLAHAASWLENVVHGTPPATTGCARLCDRVADDLQRTVQERWSWTEDA